MDYAQFILVLMIVGTILAVIWILLPLAIIGTKPLLRELLTAQSTTNHLLSELLELERRREKAAAAPPKI
jgi:hypothetical protein